MEELRWLNDSSNLLFIVLVLPSAQKHRLRNVGKIEEVKDFWSSYGAYMILVNTYIEFIIGWELF